MMCQSTMTAEDFRALQERIRARIPRECPHCHSDSEFCPTFDVDGPMYACSACAHIWSPEE